MQRVGDQPAGEGFLTAEQQRRYGRYAGEPDQAQLDRYFHLDTAARELVDIRRGQRNRLGFAVQLGTVRFLGTFLPDPADVPWSVAAHLAAQLGIADPGVLKQYAARDGTNRLHAGEIQQAYGYRDFADEAVQQDLVGWLEARTALASEPPGMLFDLATARLLEAKVLLPGPTVLARLVASVRDQAATRLWESLAAAPDAAGRARLEGLLAAPDGERGSTLDRLRRGPTSVTAAGLLGALHRLEEIRALGVGALDLSLTPPGRLEALARYGVTAKAQAIARMGQQRRTATLLDALANATGTTTRARLREPAMTASEAFTDVTTAEFSHGQRLTRDGLHELFQTHSFYLVLDDAGRAALRRQIDGVLEGHPELSGGPEFFLP